MDLKGKYLILMSGLDGSRRTEIAHLMAGGAAHLSTVTEMTEGSDTGSLNDLGGARTAYHTKVVVLSPLDCFEEKGKFSYNHTLLPDAKADTERRCELAMTKGVSMIIIDDVHLSKYTITPYLELANRYDYEVIPVRIPDVRPNTLQKRREQGRRTLPDDVHKRQSAQVISMHWSLDISDEPSFVNLEDHNGRLIEVDMGEPTLLASEQAEDTKGATEKVLTFCIEGVHDESMAGLNRGWRFLVDACGMKLVDAKNELALAMADSNTPFTCKVWDRITLLRKADEAGVIIMLEKPC